MHLAFSRFIDGDLDEIAGYIAQDNPERAVTFIEDIRAKCRGISHNPLLYQLRPDIGPGIRLASVGNYAILFRVLQDAVRIERVVYGGRNLPGIFDP